MRFYMGCPARAGMDPRRRRARLVTWWLPRTRGDGPPGVTFTKLDDPAAPHARGWTPGEDHDCPFRWGCPARAGMDPIDQPLNARDGRLPRTRGDGPHARNDSPENAQAAPHARGWTRARSGHDGDNLGCPARAGMDPFGGTGTGGTGRLPRTRGDGPDMMDLMAKRWGAAPHARGWTLVRIDVRHVAMGCPARAGMEPWPRWRRSSIRRLPRTRGDGPFADDPERVAKQGCPARAGMDPSASPAGVVAAGLPRTRGDGPC